MFTIDGVQWDLPCDIKRKADMRASDISGLMLDGSYFNDVLGTYMDYDVKIVVPIGTEERYNDLYEVLTKPVDGHSFILPYGNSIVSITGRVESVSDLYTKVGNKTHWRGIAFSVKSNYPTKTSDLGEVLTVGLAPRPDVLSPTVGMAYVYTSTGWAEMEDVDSVQF